MPPNADYDALFDMTQCPTVEVDELGAIQRVNAAASRLIGLGPRQLAGYTLQEVLGVEVSPPDLVEEPTDVVAAVDEGPVAMRLRAVERELRGSGSRTYVVQLVVREGNAATDADRRADASRMSLLDDVSHNLGTPLSIVSGYAEVLSQRWGELAEDEITRATTAIAKHAERAVDELRGLQARVRLTTAGAGTVPTAVLLAWLRRMLVGPLTANGAVLVGAADEEHVTIDVQVTRQVLLNLGRAVLAASPPPTSVTLGIARDGRGTRFTITAEPWGTPDVEYADTLDVTVTMTQQGGGRIELPQDDAPRFVVWLPDTTQALGEEPRRIAVGVIEDDPDTAALIRASLRASSSIFELVVDERTFATGLEAVRTHRPRILLLDQGLPDRLGTDGIADLHDASPGTTIVVLSGAAPQPLPHEVDDEPGGILWLEKGRVLADLGTELIGVLARGD